MLVTYSTKSNPISNDLFQINSKKKNSCQTIPFYFIQIHKWMVQIYYNIVDHFNETIANNFVERVKEKKNTEISKK